MRFDLFDGPPLGIFDGNSVFRLTLIERYFISYRSFGFLVWESLPRMLVFSQNPVSTRPGIGYMASQIGVSPALGVS